MGDTTALLSLSPENLDLARAVGEHLKTPLHWAAFHQPSAGSQLQAQSEMRTKMESDAANPGRKPRPR
jgi:hypothetical protein